MTRDMKTIAVVVASLPLFTLSAQTLTLTPAGEIRFSPPPERPAELYQSDSPRSGRWQLVTEFAAATHLELTNKSKFFRVRVKPPPLKLIAITETNQTLRGAIDKRWTNAIVVVNGLTYEGNCSTHKSRFGTNGEDPIVWTRADFYFHRIPVTNTTPAELTIWDEDGYTLTTNLFIGPGPFVPMPPPKQFWPKTNAPARGIKPVSVEDPQQQYGWFLTSHSADQFYEAYSPDPCGLVISRYNGSWDGEHATFHSERRFCDHGVWRECLANYEGGPGSMLLTSTNTCNYPVTKPYIAWSEIGQWDSTSVEDPNYQDKFTHTAHTTAALWVGGHCYGEQTNYWVGISCALIQATDRYGTEVDWNDAPPGSLRGIGPREKPTAYYIIPPWGATIDVTPAVAVMGTGWFQYEIRMLLAAANPDS